MPTHIPHLIEGKKCVIGTRQLDVFNPATGMVIGYLDVADKRVVDAAVKAARKAYPDWSATTPLQRAKILFRYKVLLEENIQSLAKLITSEHGKSPLEAIGSIQRGIEVLDYACGIPSHLLGRFANNVAGGMDCYSLQQSIGVSVGITPFNFPAMIPLWMLSMAIACGNTFILKPSEKDPSCSIRLALLAHEAGVPAGVVNVIQGDKDTVSQLITHPDVNTVSFVGSSKVAEQVYKTAIAHNKRAQAFGGAKNHALVMPDANMDQTIEAIVMAAFGSAGERCMAISVVVVVGDELADKLVAKIRASMKKIEISPLITQQHRDHVLAYLEVGKKEGAELVVGENKINNKKGFNMHAALFDHVKPSMRIYQEEIFGPVLSVVRVNHFEEGLSLINHHQYGNGAIIFTQDGYLAREFAERVQAGMVGINVPIPVPVMYQSFGGWKQSVFSDIGMYGPEAVRFYTKLKTVTERWQPKD